MILKVLKYAVVGYVGGMLGSVSQMLPYAIMGNASFNEVLAIVAVWPAALLEAILLLT